VVIVASYERDPGNAECLFPVAPNNRPITNIRNHYNNAPQHPNRPTNPPVTRTVRTHP
jgi:hypothetical protein